MNPVADIESVRGTIGSSLKATEDELKTLVDQRAALEQTINQLESDRTVLVQIQKAAGPSTGSPARSNRKPGRKPGAKPAAKAGATPAKMTSTGKRRGRPPKSAAKASAPAKRAASGKTMPETERVTQILSYINGQNGKATRSGIMESLSISQPRVQQLVAKLTAEKLITNTPNPENKVQKFIALTTKGEKALAKS